jgi:hypothetical protein
VRTIAYRYVAYSSRNLGHSGVARPIAYRPVPIRLQYRLQYVLEYLGCLIYSALPFVAPYCAPGGIRVVSEWYQKLAYHASPVPFRSSSAQGRSGATHNHSSSRSSVLCDRRRYLDAVFDPDSRDLIQV